MKVVSWPHTGFYKSSSPDLSIVTFLIIKGLVSILLKRNLIAIYFFQVEDVENWLIDFKKKQNEQ